MSNYSQTTFFTPKDSLPTTNPAKTIFGAAYDVEFGNIASAIATKYDSTQIATSPVAFNLGSTSLPGITFVSHTGTGLSSDGSGDLFISTGGVQQVEFVSGGGVVVGTATGGSQGAGTINATGLYVNGANLGNILASNNTWTGTNQFNNLLIMNSNIVGVSTSFAYTIAANPNASFSSGAYIQLYGSTNANPGQFILANSNGALLSSSGANIAIANLLTVNGGLTVNNAIATLNDGLTVNNAVASFTDGATVTGLLTVNGASYIANFAAASGQFAQINIQGNGNNTSNALSLYQYTDNNGYINSAAGSLNFGSAGTYTMTLTSSVVNIVGGAAFQIGGNPVYSGIPQNNQTSAYTTVLSDNGKHIQSTANITIPANTSVAYPVGAAITFINVAGGNTTLAINSDTLIWSPSGAVGSRTLAPYAIATALKTGATTWRLTGVGIT